MRLTPIFKTNPDQERERGIALFMVIGAMTVLSILVTEFVYIAQVNSRMAYDGLDQVRALYLTKTGLKVSLLRLRAYKHIKDQLGSASSAVPKSILDKIWSFPFMYPVPTDLPGLTLAQKDSIQKFQKDSNLNGAFVSTIEAESTGYNLNQIIKDFAPTPKASSSATPAPSASPFDPALARSGLTTYITNIIQQKSLTDLDFAEEYRDLKIDELVDAIATWSDKTYTAQFPIANPVIKPKQAPFYSISELHMVPGIDDGLYKVLAPHFTVALTQGININAMKEGTLKALIAGITQEESDAFFKFRDSVDLDNSFKSTKDFFTWLQSNVAALGQAKAISDLESNLEKQGIQLITEDQSYRISVQATVGNVTKTLQAWVVDDGTGGATPGATPSGTPSGRPVTTPSATPSGGANGDPHSQTSRPSSGFRITFMRIL